MKVYFIAFLITIFSTQILADKEDVKSSEDFKYSHLKLDLIQTDDTAIGLTASLPLPGGLYIVLQRKAEGVDTSEDSYDRIINAARIGIHAGIGDIFESISIPLSANTAKSSISVIIIIAPVLFFERCLHAFTIESMFKLFSFFFEKTNLNIPLFLITLPFPININNFLNSC